jgi:hypothetical protein
MRNSTPHPFAADPKKAIEIDRIVDQQLQAGIVGGSFPASDRISATQKVTSREMNVEDIVDQRT